MDISLGLTIGFLGTAFFFLLAFLFLNIVDIAKHPFLKIIMFFLGLASLIILNTSQYHIVTLQEITNITLMNNILGVLDVGTRILVWVSILILLYMWVMALFGTWEVMVEWIKKLFRTK